MASVGILFPNEAVPALSHLRGDDWRALVKRIHALPPDDPDALAFGLMMVQLCDCQECTLFLYRLRKGCAHCAQQSLHEAKDTDRALLRRFEKARAEIQEYLDQASATQAAQ
ncbi:MAG: hypothetical protein GXY76_14645 [Chloroflexi bacterium]|nr:hypothetical protein [Chloroflexota bacterium]